jgi:hypothetical protein
MFQSLRGRLVLLLVMLPVSMLSGKNADQWGRKPILLAAFAVLPIRHRTHIAGQRVISTVPLT